MKTLIRYLLQSFGIIPISTVQLIKLRLESLNIPILFYDADCRIEIPINYATVLLDSIFLNFSIIKFVCSQSPEYVLTGKIKSKQIKVFVKLFDDKLTINVL